MHLLHPVTRQLHVKEGRSSPTRFGSEDFMASAAAQKIYRVVKGQKSFWDAI